MTYSDRFEYRIIEQSVGGSYNPTGTWQHVRHTSADIASAIEPDMILGLSNHHGYTDGFTNTEQGGGTISMEFSVVLVEYFVRLLQGSIKTANTYQVNPSKLTTVVIERYDPSTGKTTLLKDCSLSSLQFSFSYNAINTVTATFVGGYTEFPETRPSDSGTVDVDLADIRTGVQTEVILTDSLGNAEIPLCVRQGTITLDNNIETVNPIDLDTPYNKPFNKGLINASGELTFYSDLPSFSIWTPVFNNRDIAVDITVTESDGSLPVTFHLYRTRFGGRLPGDPGNDQDVLITLNYQTLAETDGRIFGVEFGN